MVAGSGDGKAGRVFPADFPAHFTEEEKQLLMEALVRADKVRVENAGKTVLYKNQTPQFSQPSQDEIRQAVNRAVAAQEPKNIPIPKDKPPVKRQKSASEKSELDKFCEAPDCVDEICETCCQARLQIIFQRQKKIIAKGAKSETWYATTGTMTVQKVFRRGGGSPYEAEILSPFPADYVEPGYREPADNDFDKNYAERGVPGTGRPNRKGEKNMVRAATHGLAAWEGKYHSTYNYQKIVDLRKYKLRALNIMARGEGNSTKLMGKRSGVDIHVSGNWTWTEACFLPVPKGGIQYELMDSDDIKDHRKALGVPADNRAEYSGRLPYWSGAATLKLMSHLVKIVEDFAKETGQLNGKGRLPIGQLLKCVDVIIREPAKGYENIYMKHDKSGLYEE